MVVSILLLSAFTLGFLLGVWLVTYVVLEVPVDPEDAPRVHRTTTRVATLYDVPVSTIAVSEPDAPEAMAVGLRPGNVHLVLSPDTPSTLRRRTRGGDCLTASHSYLPVAHDSDRS